MQIECFVGMSLDGRIDWIQNPERLSQIYYGLVTKSSYDAVLCGCDTLLAAEMDADNTVKYSSQTLVAIDSRARIKNWDIIRKQAWWNDRPVVLCAEDTCPDYLHSLKRLGVDAVVCGRGRVDLEGAMKILEERYAIRRLRVDSGGRLTGAMLRAGLVNRITAVIAPQLTGGTSPKTIFTADDADGFESVVDIRLEDCQKLENDYVVLTYAIDGASR